MYLVLLGSPLSWLVLAVSLFAVVAYSAPPLRFKERPFLDSITSSTHFVSPGGLRRWCWPGAVLTPQLVALLAAFFLWGVASHAFGAVQDVVADREAGIALDRHRDRRRRPCGSRSPATLPGRPAALHALAGAARRLLVAPLRRCVSVLVRPGRRPRQWPTALGAGSSG